MHRRSFLAAAAALTAAVPFLRRPQPSEAAEPSLLVAVPEPDETAGYFRFNQPNPNYRYDTTITLPSELVSAHAFAGPVLGGGGGGSGGAWVHVEIGPDTWHPRWVELDPTTASFVRVPGTSGSPARVPSALTVTWPKADA